jgi:hypothetical protein
MMRVAIILLLPCFLGITAIHSSLSYAAPSCRVVGDDWVWFSDHVSMTVDYSITAQSSRKFEVGTGISVNGSVWGSTKVGSVFMDVTAYGIGGLYIRRADQGENFEVCASTSRIEVIDLCGKLYIGRNDCPTF